MVYSLGKCIFIPFIKFPVICSEYLKNEDILNLMFTCKLLYKTYFHCPYKKFILDNTSNLNDLKLIILHSYSIKELIIKDNLFSFPLYLPNLIVYECGNTRKRKRIN